MKTDKVVTETSGDSIKSYLPFWIGQLFSLFGSQIVSFVIGVWLTIEYQNEILLSISMLVSFIPSMIIIPIAGVFADRWDKKKILIISDFLQAALTVILIVLFAFSLGNVQMLVLLFVIMGLRGFCQAFQVPTAAAILPIMVSKTKLSRMNGLNFLFNAIIQMLSPVVAAALMFTGLSIGQILWIDVITFGTAVLLLIKIKIPKVGKSTEPVESVTSSVKIEETEKKSFFKDFKEGFTVIRSIKGMISMMILSLFINFLISPINVLQSFFILITHSGTEFDLALFSLSFGLGFFLGAVLASIKKEWKRKILITYGGISLLFAGIMVLGLIPVGESWSFGVMSLVGFLVAWTLPLINTVFATIMQKKVPRDKLGRVNSIDISVSSAITPLGYILSGPLAQLIGIPMLFALSGLLGIIVTVLGLIFGDLDLYRIDDESMESVNDSIMPEIESVAENVIDPAKHKIESEVITGGESTITAYVEKKKIDDSDEFD